MWPLEKPSEENSTVIAVKDSADNFNDDHVREKEPSISTFFGNMSHKDSFYDLGNLMNKCVAFCFSSSVALRRDSKPRLDNAGYEFEICCVVSNATCLTLLDRGPRNSMWQRARSTPVVCLGLEHYTGLAMFVEGSHIPAISHISTCKSLEESDQVKMVTILRYRHTQLIGHHEGVSTQKTSLVKQYLVKEFVNQIIG
ncbi:hypothetical protein TNCV_3176641 [Trichonephila clavipes]|nr:hypothetical protein TNCV_3176641 [Trichonephila clavipes]